MATSVIVLLLVGFIFLAKPEWPAKLFGWTERIVGATVIPPRNVNSLYRVVGAFLVIVGIVLFLL